MEVVEGLTREMRLLDRHEFDQNANAAKECIAWLGDLNPELTVDDTRQFDEIPGGCTGSRSAAERELKRSRYYVFKSASRKLEDSGNERDWPTGIG